MGHNAAAAIFKAKKLGNPHLKLAVENWLAYSCVPMLMKQKEEIGKENSRNLRKSVEKYLFGRLNYFRDFINAVLVEMNTLQKRE